MAVLSHNEGPMSSLKVTSACQIQIGKQTLDISERVNKQSVYSAWRRSTASAKAARIARKHAKSSKQEKMEKQEGKPYNKRGC